MDTDDGNAHYIEISSQPNPKTKEEILFNDVNSFLTEVKNENSSQYDFTIEKATIKESQIQLYYHPTVTNRGLTENFNYEVDDWLQIYLRALGYKKVLIEKKAILGEKSSIRHRLVTVNEKGKKQNFLQALLSIANGKKLRLQTQNTRLLSEIEALQSTKTDLENVLTGDSTVNSELGRLLYQKERQNEELKSLNTENSNKIAEIQRKVNDVLRELEKDLTNKCPSAFQKRNV